MSVVPEEAWKPSKVNSFNKILVERPDDALLSDDQVYSIKGGDNGLLRKVAFGLGVVGAYLYFTRRYHEVLRFEIKGSTFLTSNLIFLLSCGFYQNTIGSDTATYNRLMLHRAALYQRFSLNYYFLLDNKKKPKIH